MDAEKFAGKSNLHQTLSSRCLSLAILHFKLCIVLAMSFQIILIFLLISEITKHNYLKNGSAISDSDLICNHLILQEIPMFLLHFGSQILP